MLRSVVEIPESLPEPLLEPGPSSAAQHPFKQIKSPEQSLSLEQDVLGFTKTHFEFIHEYT